MLNVGLKEWKAIFNEQPILSAVDKGVRKAYHKVGGYTQKTAKNSCKTAPVGVSSKPGKPPNSHPQRTKKMYRYKDWIFYAFDQQKLEVIIGAVLLPRKRPMKVPKTLETGGVGEVGSWEYGRGGLIRQYELIDVKERPHMRPALGIVVNKYLESFLKDCIHT